LTRSADFIRAHTALARPPLVPELELHLATEVTSLWYATQAWLDREQVEPPFWAFAWAGGQGLARYVLDHPEVVRGRRVLDFACGGGIVALAAAQAGAARVVAADIDPLAIIATQLNATHHRLVIETDTSDWVGRDLPDFDVILAGDVFYDRAMVARVEPWLRASGREVLVGDPGRIYAPKDAVRLAQYAVPTSLELEGVAHRETSILSF
jgi:predicted nicotinamide N-methyase